MGSLFNCLGNSSVYVDLILSSLPPPPQKSTVEEPPNKDNTMAFDTADLKPFIRLLSALVGLALLALACAGFDHLSKTTGALEGQASFGCMCFLGLVFGLLLFCGESKSEHFFFFFGFMRYRIGRAVVFAIAGVMIAIIGKTMNDACKCQSFVLLIIEGVACLACAVLQIVGVFAFGNNSSLVHAKPTSAPAATPLPPSSPAAAEGTYEPPVPIKSPATTTGSSTTTKKNKKPRTDSSFDSVAPAKEESNSNLPSWMRV